MLHLQRGPEQDRSGQGKREYAEDIIRKKQGILDLQGMREDVLGRHTLERDSGPIPKARAHQGGICMRHWLWLSFFLLLSSIALLVLSFMMGESEAGLLLIIPYISTT